MSETLIASDKKILIVASHPKEDSLTINAAKYAHASLEKQGIASKFLYLDADIFNPCLSKEELVRKFSFDETTLAYQKHVSECSHLALFFPDWWGLPPALLVGWLQRVFSQGVAFDLSEKTIFDSENNNFQSTLNSKFKITPRLEHVSMLYNICSNSHNAEEVLICARAMQQRLKRFAGIRQYHTCALLETRTKSHAVRQQWIEKCSAMLSCNTWEGLKETIL